MSVDARRLRAEGVSIPTAEGEGVLRFSLLGLSVLEEDFGTVNKAWSALQGAVVPDGDGLALNLDAAPMATLARFLRAGLAAPGRVLSADDAAELVEMAPMDAWMACQRALLGAFPAPDDSGKAGADVTTTSRSTGPGSTTPPPSAGAAPTPSSGT